MIFLLGASALFLAAGQAVINGPRDSFKTCLKEASNKASSEKVGADAYDAYVRAACSGQLSSFKGAVVKFDMGNKMSKKASDEDADMMISDFVSSALDNYKYRMGSTGAAKEVAAAPAPAPSAAVTPPPTPAAAPQPPK
ncbi:hypothetical protein GCM10022276_08030 [Sphingomonas limnosediminicola]|jgi:hypothetical protein|uniref:Uncharacterized protein n=1 Tax=Sphingomonas limnosediminicola TaxID=940133 RepID=A0ABP7L0A4_9SPHN